MCLTILGLYVIVWFCLSQCFNFHQGEKKWVIGKVIYWAFWIQSQLKTKNSRLKLESLTLTQLGHTWSTKLDSTQDQTPLGLLTLLGLTLYGLTWPLPDLTLHGLTWLDLPDLTWPDLTWFTWPDLAWPNLTWLDLTWKARPWLS